MMITLLQIEIKGEFFEMFGDFTSVFSNFVFGINFDFHQVLIGLKARVYLLKDASMNIEF